MADRRSPNKVFRERFVSSDLVDVEEFLCANYADVALRHTGDRERFGYRHDVVGTGGFTVSRMRTTWGYGARLAGVNGHLVVASVRAGGFSSTSDRHGELSARPGDTVLTPPVGEVSWVSDPIDVDLVALDGAAVAAFAAHACGLAAEDLRITGLWPVSPSLARYWNATVAHVRDDVLGNPVAAGSHILADNAFRSLATAMLTAFPHTAMATKNGSRDGTVSEARLREVVDYLDAYADQPVGPAQIAEVAGAPARVVVEGLRRRRDTHPAELLWHSRLLGVHRELLDTDPAAGTTVEDVAARWGFDHPGRFRIAYVQAFAERPEDTLRR